MRYAIIIIAILAMACSQTATGPEVDGGKSMDGGIQVQYIVLGDANQVSIGFLSDLGRDSVICAILPICYDMDLDRGETAYMRVHCAPGDVVTVGILIDGWFRAIDAARSDDELAEVYWTIE